jgi:hypothetical protein
VSLAPLAVAVEIRALDVGPRRLRAFRISEGVSERALRLERELPFEPGRPVSATLSLPGDPAPLGLTGRVQDPWNIAFTGLSADERERLAAYVSERMRSP